MPDFSNSSCRDLTYIYSLRDPRDWSIRYIGKADDLKRRRRQHMYERKTAAFSEWISELKVLRLEPVITPLEMCVKDKWQEREKFWICDAKNQGYFLLNSNAGGAGTPFPIQRSPESVARIASKLRGRKASPELRAKLRKAHLGIRPSLETRRKMSETRKGKPLSEAFIAARNSHRWSMEDRAQMGRRMIGNKRGLGTKHSCSEEFRIGQREKAFRQYEIPGMREKISAATRAAMASPEMRERLRNSARRRCLGECQNV